MATLLEQESHSLGQLGRIMALYRSPNISPRGALFLATQLVNHGYAEAGGVIERLNHELGNEAARHYLARLGMRHRAIQSLPGLRAVFADRDAMQALYETEGYVFRRGTTMAGTAVVVFTTMYNNFHFSNAVLDAALSGLGVSRLFLKDTTKYIYLRGVKGLADDLRDLPAALLRLLKEKGITRYVITGHSSGGYPSLYAARRMDPLGYAGYSIYTDVSDHAAVERPGIFAKIRHEVPSELFMNLSDLQEVQSASFPCSIFHGGKSALDKAHAELLRGHDRIEVVGLKDSHHDVTSFLMEEGEFLKPFQTLVGHV